MKNKGKIIVLCGISNSGKSSYGANMVQENPSLYVLVNRDNIRELLYGYTEENISGYYQREDFYKLEKEVTLYEDTLIHEGLNLNKTVIVDATHLKSEYLKRFEFWNVPVEYIYFETSIPIAIERDSKRTRKVGGDIIKRQYNQYCNLDKPGSYTPIEFVNDSSFQPCIIFDIDGTLARMKDRSPYDWNRVEEDEVISEVRAVLDWISDSDYPPKIIICTGRDGSAIYGTNSWLAKNDIWWDIIRIRDEGDMRPDWIVKEEMWRDIAKEYYIVGMFDDRNQVCRRARALGLKVFQVEYGNF